MRILLIHPGGAMRGINSPWSFTLPLTLPYLAGLTPPDVRVELRYLEQDSIEQAFA